MEHLNAEQIRRYHAKTLSASDFSFLRTHIGSCEPCRVALLAAAPQKARAARFRFGEDDAFDGRHLEYEEKIALIEGTLPPETREWVEAHSASCDTCHREVADLAAFAAEVTLPAKPSSAEAAPKTRRPSQGAWLSGLRFRTVAALCAAVLLGIWIGAVVPRRPQSAPGPTAMNGAAAGAIVARMAYERAKKAEADLAAGRAEREALQRRAQRAEQDLARVRAALISSADKSPEIKPGRLFRARSGQTMVAIAVDAGDADALSGGITPPAQAMAALRPQGVQMGTDSASEVRQLAPEGSFVATLNPVLTWRPVSSAARYEISVIDVETNRSLLRAVAPAEKGGANTADTNEVRWPIPPERPLPADRLLRWYVRALDASDAVAAMPPTRTFLFHTLPAERVREIERKRRLYADAPLLLGGVYLRYGALDEAEAEFRAMPNSTAAARMLASIRRARRAEGQK